MSARSIFSKYKGATRFANGTYYDPDGENIGLAIVGCTDCLFRHADSCAVYKEEGWDDRKISDKKRRVSEDRHCDFFLSDFDDDAAARKEISALKDQLFGRSIAQASSSAKSKSSSKWWVWVLVGLAALYFFTQ